MFPNSTAAGPAVPGYLAVDSGGSGLRVAVGAFGGAPPAQGRSSTPVRTGDRGIDPAHLLELVVPLARTLAAEAGVDELTTAVVGAAGFATLGAALRAELPGALAGELGVGTVGLAADAVTAYIGALGARPGAALAAGTGLIAIGTDLRSWRRADGWGHLLGDCGGGAWIGRAGLEAALRAHDGRAGGSAPLLERARERFGPPPELPGLVYPRPDRAALLASFAPEVAACAPDDPAATGILRAAARHMAESVAAACPESGEPEVACTGGLLNLGEPLLSFLREELARQVPHARTATAQGDPLHGCVRLASGLAAGDAVWPEDPRLLCVTDARKRAT
ncbi:BadF/BadG/BcrA/BcrD ATPase family protein [Streptomyces sp. NPDC046860]|uniref:N-acetylglucosamine kinase n=1 Tax=Streptomyces sp. NPDC046860 TaxID=3154495 RepID=UPI0033C8C3EB